MGSFAPKGHAKLDPQHPAAFAICEMCGFLYNHRDLRWEVQWMGSEIRRTGHLVCPRCWDMPNQTLRAKPLPPDPVPILNPRTEWSPASVVLLTDNTHYTTDTTLWTADNTGALDFTNMVIP